MTISDRLREIADNQEMLQNLLQGRDYQEDGNLRLAANRAFENCATLRGLAKELDDKATEIIAASDDPHRVQIFASRLGSTNAFRAATDNLENQNAEKQDRQRLEIVEVTSEYLGADRE